MFQDEKQAKVTDIFNVQSSRGNTWYFSRQNGLYGQFVRGR